MLKKNKSIVVAMMLTFIFAASVFTLAGSYVTPKNAKDSSISGKIKASAGSYLNITTPTSANKWYINTRYDIEWTWSSFSSTYVDVYLNRSGVKLFKIFSHQYTSNMWNSYSWTIPSNASIITASNYQIYAKDVNNASNHAASANFAINATVFLANCNIIPVVYLGESVYINWVGTVASVDIDLYEASTYDLTIAAGYPVSANYNSISRSISWSIPRTLSSGSDYRIKITMHGSSMTYVYSNYFTVSTTKSIFDADTSSMVYTTSMAYVEWTSYGDMPFVDIDLYNGAALVQNIATAATNINQYSWIVPGSLAPLNSYKIKISDHALPSVNNWTATFTVNSTHAIYNVHCSDTVYFIGETLYLSWTSSPPVNSIDVILYQGATILTTIASNYADSGHYNWYIAGSNTFGTNYKIKVADHDQPSIYGYTAVFTINTSRKITYVNINSIVQDGNVGHISWDIYGLITAVDIKLYHMGVYIEDIVLNEPNGRSYSWLIPQTHLTGNYYQIKVLDHDQASDSKMSSNFTIAAYKAAKMPWGVYPGENLKWTAGLNVVMNFPDEFWQALDTLLAGMGMSTVHSKDTYNAFKAALPNSWNVNVNVESIVHENGSNVDDVIGSLTIKENTNSTYQGLGSYGGQFMQKMKTALGPVFAFIYPGDMSTPPVDVGNHLPISMVSTSVPSSDILFPDEYHNMMPSPVLPTNYSFSDNWDKMIATFNADPNLVAQFGTWSNFITNIGATVSANTTGMQASINALTLNNYYTSLPPFVGSGMGPINQSLSMIANLLHANLTISSAKANASVNYNASMILQKVACVAIVTGKFVLPNGNSFDFSMSVELYAYQGQLSSIPYLYHDPPTGLSLITILVIVGAIGAVAAVVVVLSIVRKRRGA